TWFTLPSGTPMATANPVLSTDSFRQQIVTLRWQSPGVLWVLGTSKLSRYARTTDTLPPAAWAQQEIPPSDAMLGGKKKRPTAPNWTDVAVNLDAGGAMHGTLGAAYLGTT